MKPSPKYFCSSMPKSVQRCVTSLSVSSKVPSSSRNSMRSRADILPCLCSRARRSSPPPESASESRRFSSVSFCSRSMGVIINSRCGGIARVLPFGGSPSSVTNALAEQSRRLAAVNLPEMLPTGGLQGLHFSGRRYESQPLAASDLADACQLYACNLLRDAAIGTSCEKQFVFVTAMQRERQTGNGRQRLGIYHCAGLAFFAEMSEIGGKAVADVDHRRGELLLSQEFSDCEAWLRIEVLPM